MSWVVDDVKHKKKKRKRKKKNDRGKQQQLIEGARKAHFFRDVSGALAQFFARRTSDEGCYFFAFQMLKQPSSLSNYRSKNITSRQDLAIVNTSKKHNNNNNSDDN
jgi:hypothetical protein